jgi:hypothetical protein
MVRYRGAVTEAIWKGANPPAEVKQVAIQSA